MTISKARRLLDDQQADPKQRLRAAELLAGPQTPARATPTAPARRVIQAPASMLLALAGALGLPALRRGVRR